MKNVTYWIIFIVLYIWFGFISFFLVNIYDYIFEKTYGTPMNPVVDMATVLFMVFGGMAAAYKLAEIGKKEDKDD